jgi:hypothetical protein
MKTAVQIGASLFVLLIAAVFLLPTFVDLGVFKQSYLPMVEEALHRRVDVGEVRLSLLPVPSIRLSQLKVSDSPVLPDHTFFAAQQLQLRLKFWPLLKGQFQVTEFVLVKPTVSVLKQPDGTFNFSDLVKDRGNRDKKSEPKKKEGGAKAPDPAKLAALIPSRVHIKDGELSIQTRGQQPVRFYGIDLSLQEFSSQRPFPYSASINFPGLRPISLQGELSYQQEPATLKLKDTLLKTQDVSFPVNGSVSILATPPRIHLSLANDRVDAGPVFEILSVFGLAPRETEVAGPMGLHLNVEGLANSLVTQVRGQFTDVKVHGKRALKGTVSGNIFLKLPLGGGNSVARRLQGGGRVVARDGELKNVDLISKIQRVTGIIGLSRDERREATTFKTLESDFTIGKGLVDFTRIYLINPQLEVQGSGTMTVDNPTLNLSIEATLSSQASARTIRAGAPPFFTDKHGRIIVPLRITGKVESPSVDLDGEKLTERGMGRTMEKGISSLFKQLFRRK